MKTQGLNLDFLDRERVSCERSDEILLVKNLSYKVTEELLRDTFSHFGSLERVLLAPNRAIGIVQYSDKQHAQNAFQNLSYHPLKHSPLYLEWAPIDLVEEEQNQPQRQNMPLDQAEEAQNIIRNILYIKNLNFETDPRDLQDLFENAQVGEIKSCKIVKKPDGKSAGFGFIEFNNVSSSSILDYPSILNGFPELFFFFSFHSPPDGVLIIPFLSLKA